MTFTIQPLDRPYRKNEGIVGVDPAKPQHLVGRGGTPRKAEHWITFRNPGERRVILGPAGSKKEIEQQYTEYTKTRRPTP